MVEQMDRSGMPPAVQINKWSYESVVKACEECVQGFNPERDFEMAAVAFSDELESELRYIDPIHTQALHWVIVGGESGTHARPMHPDWARSLRNQCQAAGAIRARSMHPRPSLSSDLKFNAPPGGLCLRSVDIGDALWVFGSCS